MLAVRFIIPSQRRFRPDMRGAKCVSAIAAFISNVRSNHAWQPGGWDAMTMLEEVTASPAERPFGILPVLAALEPLLPDKGLAKGSVVAVDRPGALCLALLAGRLRREHGAVLPGCLISGSSPRRRPVPNRDG